MLLKRKRSKGRRRGKRRGRRTFMARSGPTSIHLPKNGLKIPKQVDPCRPCRKEGRPLPLSLSFRYSNEKIMSFARSFRRLGHASITCIFSAHEKDHFPAKQGGALGKCGLGNETRPFSLQPLVHQDDWLSLESEVRVQECTNPYLVLHPHLGTSTHHTESSSKL